MLQLVRKGYCSKAADKNERNFQQDIDVPIGGAVNESTVFLADTTFIPEIIEVGEIDWLGLTMFATGVHASSAGDVTFKFVGSTGHDYEDIGNSNDVTITISAAGEQIKTSRLDVRGVEFIKLSRITNADATYEVTGVNCHFYGERRASGGGA